MNESTANRPRATLVTRMAHWVVPVLILAVGGLIATTMVKTKPQARREPPQRHARLVETVSIHPTSAVTRVRGMGTVIPSTEIELHPRVAGEVMAIADELVPGGRVERGQMLLQIDTTDYELAASRARSNVASVQSDVAVEMGRQAVAMQEFDMLGMDMSDEERNRVLRKPQLAKLQASLDTAATQLEQARLDLERTTVKAPFNATVLDRFTNIGAQVASGRPLAQVVGTDTFWIEVTVPVRELLRIRVPRTAGETGSAAQIYNDSAWAPGTVRTGVVARLLSELEPQGRMARLLIAVQDPLSLESGAEEVPPLLLGEYVRVEIEGDELSNVVVLDRTHLRGADKVWIRTPDQSLEIRQVRIAYEDRDHVYIDRGLSQGEQVVITDLSSPVDGLPLRTADAGAGEGP